MIRFVQPASVDLRNGTFLETQLLRGERVVVLEKQGEMCLVEALDQPYFDGSCWRGYPGSVPYSALTSEKMPPPFKEDKTLYSLSLDYLGTPYLYGGCTERPNEGQKKGDYGIDCSSLIHLIHRKTGLLIPRNAHDQFLLSKACEIDQLVSGDLVFHDEGGARITHVLLFHTPDQMVESEMEAGHTREVSFLKKFGVPFGSKKSVRGYSIYYGKIDKEAVYGSFFSKV